MYSRPPTEEEKAELESMVVGYVVDSMGGRASEEAVSEEAIRNLIDHAAIAVFDDYTYEDKQKFEGEVWRYKKLLVVVFLDKPFEPQIYMWADNDRRNIVGFDVEGRPGISYEDAMKDFEAEAEYQHRRKEADEEGRDDNK